MNAAAWSALLIGVSAIVAGGVVVWRWSGYTGQPRSANSWLTVGVFTMATGLVFLSGEVLGWRDTDVTRVVLGSAWGATAWAAHVDRRVHDDTLHDARQAAARLDRDRH